MSSEAGAVLRWMDASECRSILAQDCVGRLGVTDGRTPMIV